MVERLSGQGFADYVHEHIFQPLGMDRTAILPDLSDNAYVQAKRREAIGYDSQGQLLGSTNLEFGLYPASRATGTLEDLQKFAQALLKRETLFQRLETWTTFYTGTSTYPGTDMVRNAHGFWTSEYGLSVLSQGGHTVGFSANLLLDLESGVGMIVMTNQSIEERYNFAMPELVFGQRKTASPATQKNFEPGYYRSFRIFNSGPLSIAKIVPPFLDRFSSPDALKDEFWTLDDSSGRTILSLSSSDFEKVSDTELFTDYALTGLGLLASLFALGNLLYSLLKDSIRLISGRQNKGFSKAWKIWNYVASLATIAVPLQLLLVFQAVLKNDFSGVSPWRYMVFAGLGLVLAVCSVYPLLHKFQLSRGGKILTVLTSLSALAIVANILYWSLYQWWVF
ncbi:Beta-lactamase [Streptococcus sp. DD11]|nr:Beta-lactamase [Streptococcus sp. DD11]